MKFPHQISQPDSVDTLLRKYLLEKDPKGTGGESLLEVAGDSALQASPIAVPSFEKESEMIRLLKVKAGTLPQPGPSGIASGLKMAIVGSIATIAVIAVLVILFYGPSNLSNQDNYNQNNFGTQSATCDRDGQNKLTPAEIANGDNATSLPGNREFEAGNGENEGEKHQAWTKGSAQTQGLHLSDATDVSDPLSSSATSPATVDANASLPVADKMLQPVQQLFNALTPASELFLIDNNFDEVIKGPRGTLLYIPRHAFVSADGNLVKGKVNVEIKEVYDASSFLRSHLVPSEGGDQITSAGAIWVNATFNGKPVKLAPGMEIYTEFAKTGFKDLSGMDVYAGNSNMMQDIQWRNANGSVSSMIPIPIDNLYFEQFFCNDTRDVLWNNMMMEITDPKYSNTWIATSEFRERVRVAYEFGHVAEILKIYTQNTGKNLWEVDKMVVALINKGTDGLKGSQYHEPTRYESAPFEQFASQKKTVVSTSVLPAGLNAESNSIFSQLEQKGYSSGKVAEIMKNERIAAMRIQELETAVIGKALKKNGTTSKPKMRAPEATPWNPVAYGWAIKSLGWNFLGEKSSVASSWSNHHITVSETNPNLAAGETRAFIVIPSRNNMVITPDMIGPGVWEFSSVPSNKEGWVIMMGYKNGMMYFGMNKVRFNRDGFVQVDMKSSSVSEITKSLNVID